jgi:hypothetical protein
MRPQLAGSSQDITTKSLPTKSALTESPGGAADISPGQANAIRATLGKTKQKPTR